MKTKVKKIHKNIFEVCEVIHHGTIEQYDRQIGQIIEWEFGFEWEHTATLRRSGSCFPRRDQALRALKKVHQQHKNGLPLKAV